MRDLSRKLLPQDFEGARRLLGMEAEGTARGDLWTVTAEQARDYAEARLEGRSPSELAALMSGSSYRGLQAAGHLR